MVNVEHLALLQQGANIWNKWRADNPTIEPDLSRCDLTRVELAGAALCRVDFTESDLKGLSLARFNLYRATLRAADLSEANLDYAFVADADLSKACCRRASFTSANLGWSDLSDADFCGAKFAYTSFCNVDLSTARIGGAEHRGPSTVGTDTLLRTAGGVRGNSETQQVVETFLRGCGLHDQDIEYFRQHILHPPEYHSVFICYSRVDQDFAHRLYEALRLKRVPCWYDEKDMIIGQLISDRLREAVRDSDRVALCCSRRALTTSQWVGKEIELAYEKERSTGERIILPLDVDGYLRTGRSDRARKIKDRNSVDFSNWQVSDEFERSFSHLLKALKR